MVKKVIKGWFIFISISWMLYAASENMLESARAQAAKRNGEGDGKLQLSPVWVETYRNFKEATKIMKESRA